jgi:hypothetical protein
MRKLDQRPALASVGRATPERAPRRDGGRSVGRWLALAGAVALLAVGLGGIAAAQDLSPAEELASVPSAPDESVHYVGVVDDTEIYVAVVDRGDGSVDVYLCDGAEVAVWLEGSGGAEDGAFAATAADGATAGGTIADGTVAGAAELADGTQLTFTADLAALPAGLYERVAIEDGEPVQARTIVLHDGTAKGVKKPFDCAASETKFEGAMDKYRAAPSGSLDAYFYGNAAHNEFLRAQKAGCAWAAGPTS